MNVDLTLLKYPNETDCILQAFIAPFVKITFVKFSSILPFGASVERIFSLVGVILSPRKNQLSDEMFLF